MSSDSDSCCLMISIDKRTVFPALKTRWMGLASFDAHPSTANLDALLEHLEEVVVQRMEDRRVFRAVIECVQNLERHADPDRRAQLNLMGRSCCGEPRFKIRSVNAIRKNEIQQVEQWIRQYGTLQEMTVTSMKDGEIDWRSLYRQCLDSVDRTPRGGAGLGWVSLAKTAIRAPHIRIIHASDGPKLFFSVEVACTP
jgi:hypothetical protein